MWYSGIVRPSPEFLKSCGPVEPGSRRTSSLGSRSEERPKSKVGGNLENPGFSWLLVLSTTVRGLEMPVGECLCIARGACPFVCPWSALCVCLLHIRTCTTELYSSTVQKERADTNERTNERTNEPRTKFHLIERIKRNHLNFKMAFFAYYISFVLWCSRER